MTDRPSRTRHLLATALLGATLLVSWGCDAPEPETPPDPAPGSVASEEPEEAGEPLEILHLADMEIEAPGGVEDLIPFPSPAAVHNVARPQEGLLTVAFEAQAVFEELAERISAFLEESTWEVTDESVGQATAGEVGADWRMSGHGVRVSITLIGFDGVRSPVVTGSIIVLADD